MSDTAEVWGDEGSPLAFTAGLNAPSTETEGRAAGEEKRGGLAAPPPPPLPPPPVRDVADRCSCGLLLLLLPLSCLSPALVVAALKALSLLLLPLPVRSVLDRARGRDEERVIEARASR